MEDARERLRVEKHKNDDEGDNTRYIRSRIERNERRHPRYSLRRFL